MAPVVTKVDSVIRWINLCLVDNAIGFPNILIRWIVIYLAPVQTLDSAIQRINHYPGDNAIVSCNTYPLDSDLSGG